ncbi:MAG: HD domain-containing protein [Thermoguttaceae bacterium]|jgi:3'-5' exoribonuclease
MVLRNRSITLLSEMVNAQRGVFYAHLLEREARKTKDGKPFYRVVFTDGNRQVHSVFWDDSPLFEECRSVWKIGVLYKIDATYRITKYGPQIQIFQIRETKEKDFEDGFPERFGIPSALVRPEILYDEIRALAKSALAKGSPLQLLVLRIFKEYREQLLNVASSRSNHHAYPGGFLEHTLSVAKTAVFLAEHFATSYPASKNLFSRDLVTAGAILHEIGKVEEMDPSSRIPLHTPSGDLLGYPVLGRDIVRKFASEVGLDTDLRLRLEHILVAHPRFSDWGAVKPPASIEALIVHQADYADSLFATVVHLLKSDTSRTAFTAAAGPFGAPWFKPVTEKPAEERPDNFSLE